MIGLFKRIAEIPKSKLHTVTLVYTSAGYFSIGVHLDTDGTIVEIVYSDSNTQEEIIAFLDKWTEIISEEAKHDNEGTG